VPFLWNGDRAYAELQSWQKTILLQVLGELLSNDAVTFDMNVTVKLNAGMWFLPRNAL